MTSAKEVVVFESILPQQKKGNDDVTSLEFGEGRGQTKVQFYRPFHPSKKGRRR